MTNRTEWLIYGQGVSSLVLAERLASAGKQVVLVNPGNSWGGIFGGVNIDGDIFDAGMTNFEFDLFGEPDDNIQNYLPDRNRDVCRYVHFVKEYLSLFVKAAPIETPSMRFGNEVVQDLIISNRFEVLNVLEPHVRDAIRTELEDILAAPNSLHPRNKGDPRASLVTSPFEEVSISNHGPTFHGLFIEPIFRKILGISTSEIEGVFHRNGWAPLFYPESLLSQFGSSPQVLKPTIFQYPSDTYFGAFIGRIAERVRAQPNVRVIEFAKNAEINVAASKIQICDEDIYFQRLAWGGELAKLLSPFEPKVLSRRANLDLFFLKVKASGVANRFTVLIDPGTESPFYRVTNQSICSGNAGEHHKIIFECNSVNWEEESIGNSLVLDTALHRYGIDAGSVAYCQRRSFKGALAIPSNAQMKEFNYLRDRVIQAFPDVELIGPSSGYVSVTLNDQIIQALKIAQQEGVGR